MAVKTITITEEAYNLLKSKKQGEESFSELIIRQYANTKSFADLRGIFKDDKEFDRKAEIIMWQRKKRREFAQKMFDEEKRLFG